VVEAAPVKRNLTSVTTPRPTPGPSSLTSSAKVTLVTDCTPRSATSVSIKASPRSGDKCKAASAISHSSATHTPSSTPAKVPNNDVTSVAPHAAQVSCTSRPIATRAIKSESVIPKTMPTSSTPPRRATSERRPLPPIPVENSTATEIAPATRPHFDIIALIKSNKLNWDAQCNLWYVAARKHGELARWKREWTTGKRPMSKIDNAFVEDVMLHIRDDATEAQPTAIEIAKPPFDIMALLKADKQLWDQQRSIWYALADKAGELPRWKREWDAGHRPSELLIDDRLVEAVLKRYTKKSEKGKNKQALAASKPSSKRSTTSNEPHPIVPTIGALNSEHRLRRWSPFNRWTQLLADGRRPEPNSTYAAEWTTFPRGCLKPSRESSVHRSTKLKGKQRDSNVHWTDESWDLRIWYREEVARQECEDAEARALETLTAAPSRPHSWGPKAGESSKVCGIGIMICCARC